MEMRPYNIPVTPMSLTLGRAAGSCRPSEFKRSKKMAINRIFAKYISVAALVLGALFFSQRVNAQSLTMDGESGIFLQPLADVVPSPQHKFGEPTVSFHAVDAGMSSAASAARPRTCHPAAQRSGVGFAATAEAIEASAA